MSTQAEGTVGTGAGAASSSPRGRLTELDGLRSLAILPVIFNHCYPFKGWWGWTSFVGRFGWIGVDLFFVLSGYLITGILLDTVAGKNYYRNFYIRRTLRIFPLYYLCLAVFTLITKSNASAWESMRAWGGVGWFFAYLGNVRVAWTDAAPPVFSFVPLWSLQVEEQFYLIYPAVVLLLSRLRLRQLLIVCVIAAPLLRSFLLFFFPASDLARWALMPCRMDSLAIGGLVALFMRSPLVQVVTPAQVRIGALVAGTVVLVGLIVLPETNPIMSSVGYTAIDTVCALVLTMVLLRPSGVPARWLRWRPLVYTGQISYGLYVLQAPSSWLARSLLGRLTGHEIQGHSGFSVLITFAAAFVAAGVSWRCFESPILALKDRFARYAAPTVFYPAENKSTRAPRSLSYPWNPAYSPAVPDAAKGRPGL